MDAVEGTGKASAMALRNYYGKCPVCEMGFTDACDCHAPQVFNCGHAVCAVCAKKVLVVAQCPMCLYCQRYGLMDAFPRFLFPRNLRGTNDFLVFPPGAERTTEMTFGKAFCCTKPIDLKLLLRVALLPGTESYPASAQTYAKNFYPQCAMCSVPNAVFFCPGCHKSFCKVCVVENCPHGCHKAEESKAGPEGELLTFISGEGLGLGKNGASVCKLDPDANVAVARVKRSVSRSKVPGAESEVRVKFKILHTNQSLLCVGLCHPALLSKASIPTMYAHGYWLNLKDFTLRSGPPLFTKRDYAKDKRDRRYVDTGDVVELVCDTHTGMLCFEINGVDFGVAFDDVFIDDTSVLCPAIALFSQLDFVQVLPN